ncbi:SDR family NAD(P)-dependent oxidoreductase [Hymenobacter busanensis]|uniref:SDR family NAD(P)-dependent oxidoreductase n=1 Tax=Hymenobacter busanensis TaxID=2607656 RepID=A0A7L4ZVR8_9BACT|nr:SDR family NAD(P)-dependent oxidoreductase [Hymenobacter busanensis]KAA9339303.1 SDR family NAD(P)-dependent oxidoreductase [Hymenobacter busanensis]QHJ06935.1 SDR family NAD(P)-dependent oxidoreductase [Hymenobacter busanensis]
MSAAAHSKTIVITGVSSGLGLATAQAFLARGYRVFGSVRQPADAARLQQELGSQFQPLLFDVTDAAAIEQAVAEVARAVGDAGLGGLINNAGVAFGGPLLHQPLAVVRQHFDVNVLGLVQVTQAFLPLLGARPGFAGTPGRVINIGSVSGQVAAPFVGAYVGTKHALEGISHTWRRELQLFGIDMVLIGLGVTNTPIWDKGIDLEAYRDTPYYGPAQRFARFVQHKRDQGLDPAAVAARLVGIFETPRPQARYTIVPNRLQDWVLPRLLPARLLDRLIGRQIGLLRAGS